MLNVETLFGLETVSETVLLIELQTPAASSTDQTKNTETTVTIPNAIASTNDTFITDQGSMRLSRSRALRGPVAAPVRRVVAVVAVGARTGATSAVSSGSGCTARTAGSAGVRRGDACDGAA